MYHLTAALRLFLCAPALPLYPRSATSFLYLAVDAEMDFRPDAGGLVLHQGGHDVAAPRIP